MRYFVSCLAILEATLCSAPATSPLEIEWMVYPEVYTAIHQQGKTTVLIYNRGTEQRGPQDVLGGRTIMARRTGVEITRRLGNTLVAPVLRSRPRPAICNRSGRARSIFDRSLCKRQRGRTRQ